MRSDLRDVIETGTAAEGRALASRLEGSRISKSREMEGLLGVVAEILRSPGLAGGSLREKGRNVKLAM